MSGGSWGVGGKRRLPLRGLIAGAIGCAALALAGVALATTYTVQTAKSSVTNQSQKTVTEKIVVNSSGFALYELTGDTKKSPKCTKANGCYQFWPPATVTSTQARHLKKGPGVPGTLSTWKHGGIIQLTLSGHPLYKYIVDAQPHSARGQGVNSFGGTWFVIKAVTRSSSGTGGW